MYLGRCQMNDLPRPATAAARPRLLVPFALGHFANDLAPVGMYLIIPAFGVAAGLSPVEIGLLFTIHSFGSALAYLPAGIVTDHVSNRGILLLTTFFWVGLGYIGASFASDYWTFALLITIAGAGDAAWHPMATGVLASVDKDRRAYAFGVHALGGHMAEVVSLVLTGYLLSLGDWSFALQIIAVPALIMGCVFFFLVRRVPLVKAARPKAADFADIWRTWATRSGFQIVSLFSCYNIALFAILTMTPVFLQRDHGFDWQETSIALALMMVLGALAQPVMGRLSDRMGRWPLIVCGNGIAAIGASAAWMSTSLVWILVSLAFAMTVLVAIRAVILAAAVDHAGKREGTSLGMAFAFMDGIGALGAVLAGFVGRDDLSYAFLLASVFSALAVGLAVLPFRSRMTAY
jgi:FSR family fosmidomycin resistance protein-like MFS transporter